MDPTQLRASVLLSTQRALLGHIGTAVRKIMCRWTQNEIQVRVVFDGEVREEDAEAISEAETEVIADFPPSTSVVFRIERCDSPAHIKQDDHEVAVYRRLERQ